MNKKTLHLAIDYLHQEWEQASNWDNEGLWVAVHQPILGGASEPNTPVEEVYFITTSKCERKELRSFKIFIELGLPKTMNKKLYDIAYASVCEYLDTANIYIGFQFGPRYGRGGIFSLQNSVLHNEKDLWVS